MTMATKTLIGQRDGVTLTRLSTASGRRHGDFPSVGQLDRYVVECSTHGELTTHRIMAPKRSLSGALYNARQSWLGHLADAHGIDIDLLTGKAV